MHTPTNGTSGAVFSLLRVPLICRVRGREHRARRGHDDSQPSGREACPSRHVGPGGLKSRPRQALCKPRRPDVYARPLTWILTFTLASVAAVPACADGLNFTNAYDGDKRVESCSDMRMNFWKTELGKDGIVTVRRSQTISLASLGSKPLKVEASDRGGIHVQPSTDGSFSALVCMAAGAASNGDAEAILQGLSVENSDGHLTVDGPDNGQWAAMIVLSVPVGVTLDLSAANGGLELYDVDGKFTLRTKNGPIAMARVGGLVDAQTDNGPIQFRGHAGDVRLTALNGPVEVNLDAARWSGKGLDASTQNGPIKLTAPDNLKSGVEVMGSWGSPATWNGMSQPIRGQMSGPRKFHFGSDEIVVQLSTMRGPVEIEGPKGRPRGVKI